MICHCLACSTCPLMCVGLCSSHSRKEGKRPVPEWLRDVPENNVDPATTEKGVATGTQNMGTDGAPVGAQTAHGGRAQDSTWFICYLPCFCVSFSFVFFFFFFFFFWSRTYVIGIQEV